MGLTVREREVLLLMSQDKTNREIAKTLGLSVHTVRKHVETICKKLGARSRLGAVMLGIRDGHLSWEEVIIYWIRYT